MKFKRDSKSWRPPADMDTESDANDYEPLMSDATDPSRRSFGTTCMFPDASETTDFDTSSKQPAGQTGGGPAQGPDSAPPPGRHAYFFQSLQGKPKIETTIDDALSRFKYYSKIKNFIRREDTNPRLSDQGVPPYLPYIPGTEPEPGKQSSIITIFSIWNTIIGSSLLTLPWSMEKAGLASGIFLILLMGAVCLYTAYLLLRVQQLHGGGHVDWEVSDLAGFLLGKHSELIAKLSSLVVLLGALIVYWVLMSNFLYHSVDYLYETIAGLPHESMYIGEINTSAICPNNASVQQALHPASKIILKRDAVLQAYPSLYDEIWNLETTVPVFLILVIGPLVNFESATFFTKFNSLGTLSVLYLLAFVLVKSFIWGINIDFRNPYSPLFVANFSPSFPVLTGMLALALFIHNIVITIMRNNKHQEKNGRDLSIAFVLVVLTYLIVGVVFYVTFPLDKSCIEANLLDNFQDSDVMTVVARVFLFFQLVTVYPLIIYMLRVQLFSTLMKKVGYPELQHILMFNGVVIAVCVLFAIFLPRIGTIIRFTGALSGFIYIFTLPSLLHLASLHRRGKLTCGSAVVHAAIIALGFANIVAQFLITEE